MRKAESEGNGAGRLAAPGGKPFDGKDASERDDRLGRRDSQSGAAPLECPLGETEIGRDSANDGRSDGQIQSPPEDFVGVRVSASLQTRQQPVDTFHIGAPEDCCIDGAEFIVQIGV